MKLINIAQLTISSLLLLFMHLGWAQEVEKTSPINVIFGTQTLTPDTPINNRVPFVSQEVSLPTLSCTACNKQSHWQSEWSVPQGRLLMQYSQPAQGWYLFSSGVDGIAISVQTSTTTILSGVGTPGEQPSVTVGLVRLSQQTGAGLAALPSTEFTRLTTFADSQGNIISQQQDAVMISADLTVPTCMSDTGSLQFQLEDMNQLDMQQLPAGEYSEAQGSLPQELIADCSVNTQQLSIAFLPLGAVTDAKVAQNSILVAHDKQGQETGLGYLLHYQAQGFGQQQQGVVQWQANSPLVISNPHPQSTSSGELTQTIRVVLQAFYARAENQKPIIAGQMQAKGLYQISYQ